MDRWQKWLRRTLPAPVPTYQAERFDEMLRDQRPDLVVVCTVDATHDRYVVAALEAGADVACEKPLTTDGDKLAAILEAKRNRPDQRLNVLFNYRYRSEFRAVKALLDDGVVGRPLAVDLSWPLDVVHGADYFRRWHRDKRWSGGLLVHKCTHHFDLINHLLDDEPELVFALGRTAFYGEHGAGAAASDPRFELRLDHPALHALYAEAEVETGYVRNQPVFDPGVTTEDTLSVTARYRGGVQLTYSLVAYSPWEGVRLAITGTEGRIELFDRHVEHETLRSDLTDGMTPDPGIAGVRRAVVVWPMFGRPYEVPLEAGDGTHGDADSALVDQLFHPIAGGLPIADEQDAARSLSLSFAANESITTGLPVRIPPRP